jgi:hypothetical protein
MCDVFIFLHRVNFELLITNQDMSTNMENLICNQEVTVKINNDLLRLQWLFCSVLLIKVYVTLTRVTKYKNRDKTVSVGW